MSLSGSTPHTLPGGLDFPLQGWDEQLGHGILLHCFEGSVPTNVTGIRKGPHGWAGDVKCRLHLAVAGWGMLESTSCRQEWSAGNRGCCPLGFSGYLGALPMSGGNTVFSAFQTWAPRTLPGADGTGTRHEWEPPHGFPPDLLWGSHSADGQRLGL